MGRIGNRYRSWVKVIAMAVVCLFTVNTLAWSYPDASSLISNNQNRSKYQNNNNSSTTLQVQSMFSPILDVVGAGYDTQVRLELACILSMALSDGEVPFQDINSEIDKWIAAAPHINQKRLLDVTANPGVADGKAVIEVELFSGPSKGERFRITSETLEFARIKDETGLTIERIEGETLPAMAKRAIPIRLVKGKGETPYIEVESIEFGLSISRVELKPQGSLDWYYLSRAIAEIGDLKESDKDLALSIVKLLAENTPEFYVLSRLEKDLFGVSIYDASMSPGVENVSMIGLHSSVVSDLVARFHEACEYLMMAGKLSLSLHGNKLHVVVDDREFVIQDVSGVMREMLQEGELWIDMLKYPTFTIGRNGWLVRRHDLLRVMQRAIFGDLDKTLTEKMEIEQVVNELSQDIPMGQDRIRELEEFYARYKKLVSRDFNRRTVASSANVYRKHCMHRYHIADMFYLKAVYGFDMFDLLEKGRTTFTHKGSFGFPVTYEFTYESTSGSLVAVMEGPEDVLLASVTDLRYGSEDGRTSNEPVGRGVFLVNVYELIAWAIRGETFLEEEMSRQTAINIGSFYSLLGYTLEELDTGRIRASKDIFGSVHSFLLTVSQAQRMQGLSTMVFSNWSQRDVDRFLRLTAKYDLYDLQRGNRAFSVHVESRQVDVFEEYFPENAAAYIEDFINKHPYRGTLRDIGEEGEGIPEDILHALLHKSREEKTPLRNYKFNGEKVDALVMLDGFGATLPNGIYATHFYDPETERLIIVVDRELPGEVDKEAVFHEWKEYHWETKLINDGVPAAEAFKIAHILASAEGVLEFGKEGLVAFHKMQFENMGFDQNRMQTLIHEDREEHYRIIERYLGEEVRKKIERYEEYFKERMRVIVLDPDDGLLPDTQVVERDIYQIETVPVARSLESKNSLVDNLTDAIDGDLKGKKVLGIGANRAEHSITTLIRRGADVTAADRDSLTLERLTRSLANKGVNPVTTRVISAHTKFDFEDGAFDAIAIQDAIHPVFGSLDDFSLSKEEVEVKARRMHDLRKEFFAECRRVLKSGGVLVGIDIETPEYQHGDTAANIFDDVADVVRAAELAGFEVLKRNRGAGVLVLRKIEIDDGHYTGIDDGPRSGGMQPQMGKRGTFISLNKNRRTARVKDSDGNIHEIQAVPRGDLDISKMREMLADMSITDDKTKSMMLAFLHLFEKSPPKWYVFNELIEDTFGFVSLEDNAIGIHSSLLEDPIALFHEIGEFLIKRGDINIVMDIDTIMLSINGDVDEQFAFELSDNTYQALFQEDWWDGIEGRVKDEYRRKEAHYTLRILQRELFGEQDIQLTKKLRILQGDNVVILAGASGSGKTTLMEELIKKYPGVFVTPATITTRKPRTGEVAGKFKRFVSEEEFRRMKEAGELVLVRPSHGHWYGVAKKDIAAVRGKGKVILFDTTSAKTINLMKGEFPDARLVMVTPFRRVPKNTAEIRKLLEERLKVRGLEDGGKLEKRLQDGVDFIRHSQRIKADMYLLSDDMSRLEANLAKTGRQILFISDEKESLIRSDGSESEETHSSFANLFQSGIWKALVALSTIFHEFGHIVWGRLSGQRPVFTYGDYLKGRIEGVSGSAHRYGGILGNFIGAIAGLPVYFTLFEYAPQIAIFLQGWMPYGLGYGLAVAAGAYISGVNLVSLCVEFFAGLFTDSGDLSSGRSYRRNVRRRAPNQEEPWNLSELEGVAPLEYGTDKDYYIVGDVHADLGALRLTLEGLGLIRRGADPFGLEDKWLPGEVVDGKRRPKVLVQGGDVVDRGRFSLEAFRYMRYIQGEAKAAEDRVVRLLGNHELSYLMRHAKGKWTGQIERFKNLGDLRDFDEDLWADDKEFVAMLEEDVESNNIIAAFDIGGKVSTHALSTPEMFERLSRETLQDVRKAPAFVNIVNKILKTSVRRQDYKSNIFSMGLGVIDKKFTGMFTMYFSSFVLKGGEHSPEIINKQSRSQLARLVLKDLYKSDPKVGEMPFDQIVFHDPTVFMGLRKIPVFRVPGKEGREDHSIICGDVGMTDQYGRGRGAIVIKDGQFFQAYPSKFHSGRTGPRKKMSSWERSVSDINTLFKFETAMADGSLLEKGLAILDDAFSEDIKTVQDVMKLNPRATTFDICILPFLETPSPVFSNPGEDWGIYDVTADSVEYRTGDEGFQFINFKKELRANIERILTESEELYYKEEIDDFTRHIVANPDGYPAKKLLDRARGMIYGDPDEAAQAKKDAEKAKAEGRDASEYANKGAALSPGNKRKMSAFLGEDKIDQNAIYAIFGLLERLPELYKFDLERKDWYWMIREDGVEFVCPDLEQRELVPYTKDEKITNPADSQKTIEVLQAVGRLGRNTLVAALDRAALNSSDGKVTEYDTIRLKIMAETDSYIPLAYDHYSVCDAVSSREGKPLPDVFCRRFSVTEMEYLLEALRRIPDKLNKEVKSSYYSYRPKGFQNFAINVGLDTEYAEGAFGMAPAEESKWEDMDTKWMNVIIEAFLKPQNDESLKKIAFMKNILHEKARHIYYAKLSEEERREYSAISWNMNSWNTKMSSKKKKDADVAPGGHFLFVSDTGADSSKGDFADHFAAYILFGHDFRRVARDLPSLQKKYDFLKDHIFDGEEFGVEDNEELEIELPGESSADDFGMMGKNVSVEETDAALTGKVIVRDTRTGTRFRFPVKHAGKVVFKELIAEIEGNGKMPVPGKELLQEIVGLVEEEVIDLYTFKAMVGDLAGFARPENKFIAVHESLENNAVAIFHEIAEYLIRSGRLKVTTDGERISVFSVNGSRTSRLGVPVQIVSAEAAGQLEKGADDHYLLRALQRELFGLKDEDLTNNIKLLKQDAEHPGDKKVYRLGGGSGPWRLKRSVGSGPWRLKRAVESGPIWIEAGQCAYKVELRGDMISVKLYDKIDGKQVGEERRVGWHRDYMVGSGSRLKGAQNAYYVNDTKLSREHFSIKATFDSFADIYFEIEDLGSTHGTTVHLASKEQLTAQAEELPVSKESMAPVVGAKQAAEVSKGSEAQALGSIKDSNRTALAVMKEVERYLVDKAAPGRIDRPVDVVIDISLLSRKDLKENMETWAYLIYMCSGMKNVNFRFELPELDLEKFVSSELVKDRLGAPTRAEVVGELKEQLRAKSYVREVGDAEAFVRERISTIPRKDAIEVPLISKGYLEWMRSSGKELGDAQFPVALEGVTEIKDKDLALRNFEAALSLGLVKATLAIAKDRDDDPVRAGEEKELPELRKKLLGKVQKLYSVFRKDVNISEKTLDTMVHPDSNTRLHQAISLALPPITRMVYEKLRSMHENLHMVLMAA